MTTDLENPSPPAAPPEIPAEAASAVSAAQPGRPRLEHVPRLSIAHLLLWTAATAVELAVMTQAAKAGTLSVGAAPVNTVIGSLFSGAALAGLSLIVWHKARGTLWRLEPGGRLVLAQGLVTLARLPFWIVFIVAVQSPYGGLNLVLPMLIVMFATDVGVYIGLAIAARRQAWWSAVLWTEALCYLALGISNVMMILSRRYPSWMGWWTAGISLSQAIILALLTTAIVLDRRRHAQRHWLHWLGATVVGGPMVIGFVRFAITLALRH